jgi:hypothetical protein
MLLDKVKISNLILYIVLILLLSVVLRSIISAMRALEVRFHPVGKDEDKEKGDKFIKKDFFNRFFIVFNGFSKEDPTPDLWYNFIIGTIELAIFPVLISASQYPMIGAWIAFKTVAQWEKWNKNRLVFNRFLIATAFVLIVSYCLAKWFIICKDLA